MRKYQHSNNPIAPEQINRTQERESRREEAVRRGSQGERGAVRRWSETAVGSAVGSADGGTYRGSSLKLPAAGEWRPG